MERVLAATVLERCDALATFSEEPERLTRRFATDALRLAGEAVADWMRAAGMTVRRDAIGNVIGRYAGAGESTSLGGSTRPTSTAAMPTASRWRTPSAPSAATSRA